LIRISGNLQTYKNRGLCVGRAVKQWN